MYNNLLVTPPIMLMIALIYHGSIGQSANMVAHPLLTRSYRRLLLIAVAMAVLSGAIAAPLQEPSLQEALAYINTLHSQEVSNGKLKDLYEALLRRGGEDIEDDALLQAKIIEFLQAHDLQNKADKRASCEYPPLILIKT
ncbi:unnamed protein product [Nezara viridula]|uniref:Neuropeptide n=1 Tax=Nezara viridula TaxID=85310 RepID=A0A9P0HKS2_NEZVI|nr:unnamed protein product [Nezara viridula]